jgi:histidinol dehydrogenase
MKMKTEKIDTLTPDRRKGIMERSMEDISVVFEDVRGIVDDIKKNGDAVTLAHYRKHKEDITPSDLEATGEEIAAAYDRLDPTWWTV